MTSLIPASWRELYLQCRERRENGKEGVNHRVDDSVGMWFPGAVCRQCEMYNTSATTLMARP